MPKNVFKPLHAGDVRQYVVNKKKKKKFKKICQSWTARNNSIR